MDNIFDISNKTVIVTGGTRGIGLSIALALKERGSNVWIHGSNEEKTKIVSDKYGFKYLSADLRDLTSIDNMFEKFSKTEKTLDVLINNAGYELHEYLENLNITDLDNVNNVNFKAPMIISNKFLPLLKKSDYPSIINISSIHQTVPVKTNSYYCTAKASLEMFAKIASLEWAKYKIRVNNIAPGAIRTDMNKDLLATYSFDKWIPLERVGDSEEIVGPVIFLAAKASSYITGTTIFVDGGYQNNLLRY